MAKTFTLALLLILSASMVLSQDVTWYEYYTAGGRQSGLVPASADGFTLNGKPFRIVSGSMHYFRTHPAYRQDRLRKLRALGANTLELYLPWNLHEPRQGVYDFGNGTSDMSIFLDVRSFVQMAREEDLFVIMRPGPFICAEWDFGGMPSWILRDPNMKIRSNYPGWLGPVTKYYDQIFQRLGDLQFTKGDGPIIAFQIENEYAAFGSDTSYLINLREAMVASGAVEMFFTSDNGGFNNGRIPGTLTTANLNTGAEFKLNELRLIQPDFPLMVTEYWSGWFDSWGQGYHDTGLSSTEFKDTLSYLFSRNSSANIYPFYGGTTFGFLNGANAVGGYRPVVSSYDFDSPLSEAGDYTAKYYAAKEVIAQYQWIPNLFVPQQPAPAVKTAYPAISATQHLTLENLLSQVPADLVIESPTLIAMEDLPINDDNGQSFGFTHYRKTTQLSSGQHTVQISGRVHDLAVFMVDEKRQNAAWDSMDKLTTFGYYNALDSSLDFTAASTASYTLDFLVECMGRNDYGTESFFVAKCGLSEGPVTLDGTAITNWTIYPLEFTKAWMNSLTGWINTPAPAGSVVTPTLTRSVLTISGTPTDTFIDFSDFGTGNRGAVFVNGFNIGRFSVIGPQKTMFLPSPFLQSGRNTIDVFALFSPVTDITFTATPNLG